MARNTLKLDTSGFERMIRKLNEIGADTKTAVQDALTDAGKQIAKDTHAAVQKAELPAKGVYSTGATERSIIDDPAVEWNGTVASIPVGFDFSKPGAGGYLISGTPKMRPDKKLNSMYKGKKYMAALQQKIGDQLMTHIVRKMEE